MFKKFATMFAAASLSVVAIACGSTGEPQSGDPGAGEAKTEPAVTVQATEAPELASCGSIEKTACSVPNAHKSCDLAGDGPTLCFCCGAPYDKWFCDGLYIPEGCPGYTPP